MTKNKALFVKFVAFVRKKSAFGFFTAFIPILFKEKIKLLHGKRARKQVILRVYVEYVKSNKVYENSKE
jgi:hypothetical protein